MIFTSSRTCNISKATMKASGEEVYVEPYDYTWDYVRRYIDLENQTVYRVDEIEIINMHIPAIKTVSITLQQ